jgi:hypothetical protein
MRRRVIEIECGRCHRTEHLVVLPPKADSAPIGEEPEAFKMVIGDVVVRFDDLCTTCSARALKFAHQFGKPMVKKSPNRKKNVLQEETPPPKKPTSETKGPTGPGVSPATPMRAPR